MAGPALILHGGLSGLDYDRVDRALFARRVDALERLRDRAWEILVAGSALEAVVAAVREMEDDPLFNAGTGAKLQADGRARLSAAVMDGSRQRFSGVVNLERVRHPVEVALRLQQEDYRVLAGPPATEWARSRGFADHDPVTPERRRQWEDGLAGRHGTVGACAVDALGRLAVATSTGGRGMETVGRMSDSPTVAGNYADGSAAVSSTGVGEDIVDEALAARLVLGAGGSLEERFAEVLEACRGRDRDLGAIGASARGEVAWGCTRGTLTYAWRRADGAAGSGPR